MIAKAYSYDLRQKVMQAIELDGMKKSEASEVFTISSNTINLWFQCKAETGDIQVKPRVPSIGLKSVGHESHSRTAF